jgi:hypothetical protein
MPRDSEDTERLPRIIPYEKEIQAARYIRRDAVGVEPFRDAVPTCPFDELKELR